MSTIISDYHMHTPLCGHAVGTPEEYAKQALKVGLKEIGFSDHAPMVHKRMPGITMTPDELPQYHQMIEKVKDQFKGKLDIKVGIEADFIPGFEEKTKAIVTSYPYDYVIGSVHFIKDWGFDNPEEREKWDQQDTNAVYNDYHELLRQSAQTGLYHIMGHVDLVKKFGHRPPSDFADDVRQTAKVFKESGVVIEINTSGLRKPVKEMYPAQWILKIYCEEGVPLTFGSDSHTPGDVGKDFDKAYEMAKEVGYKEYVLFSKGKIERSVAL